MSTDHPDTPNIPSASAIFCAQSSTVIDAPIDQVWITLTDTSTWPSWNKFVPRVTIREQPDTSDNDSPTLKLGSRITFHVNMYPNSGPGDASETQPNNAKPRDTFLRIIECEAPSSSTLSGTETGTRNGKKARIVWASDASADGYIMSTLLTAERVHELREVEVEGKTMTEVRNWESQVGYLAYVVRWMFDGRLKENFKIWESGLKRFAEGL
ncbi:SRPBCC domain-containing protein [Aspergillus lucknowensis]|uniref:Uncharacterized protein n=1 Tax=Aspergillus lucknowensis TaxID=176173 RepID=A0ABR4LP02_9EURO